MSLRISGKQMEIGDAFRTRIEDRINEAVDKYFDGGFSGKVTVEKNASRFDADCTLHIDTGVVLQSAGRAMDPQAAFDEAAEKLEKRLRRYKRRLKSHHRDSDTGLDIAYRVMAPVADEDEEVPEDFAPTVVAESTLSLRQMSVASAVIELDMKDSPVFVFRNSANDQVNIVYRRADGNIGWIDPSSGSMAAE
ncbi:ribosomal subunit interface protein [Zhengella mangrovi]|uniref:Ribosome hibernation promoting factor n=1 Tax=Zhengella mangrovi TaxID=1982044 RepID=A0A2G1QT76_9HYPH|nr:ribosome-associated translation inhibitor RaiA [Zhengella mangrovi]PHP68723.1 ribosomal subunit interface protein [Zhengella mangrovi]